MSNQIVKTLERVIRSHHEIPQGDLLSTRDEHHVHLLRGHHWKYSDRDAALVTTATLTYLIEITDYDVELTFVAYGSAASHVQFFEAPTYSAKGTPQIGYNHHRHAAKIPSVFLYKGPALSTDGVSLLHLDVGSGAAPGRAGAGGLSIEHDPWILRANTYYLLRLTNSSGSDIIVNMQIDWYDDRH